MEQVGSRFLSTNSSLNSTGGSEGGDGGWGAGNPVQAAFDLGNANLDMMRNVGMAFTGLIALVMGFRLFCQEHTIANNLDGKNWMLRFLFVANLAAFAHFLLGKTRDFDASTQLWRCYLLHWGAYLMLYLSVNCTYCCFYLRVKATAVPGQRVCVRTFHNCLKVVTGLFGIVLSAVDFGSSSWSFVPTGGNTTFCWYIRPTWFPLFHLGADTVISVLYLGAFIYPLLPYICRSCANGESALQTAGTSQKNKRIRRVALKNMFWSTLAISTTTIQLTLLKRFYDMSPAEQFTVPGVNFLFVVLYLQYIDMVFNVVAVMMLTTKWMPLSWEHKLRNLKSTSAGTYLKDNKTTLGTAAGQSTQAGGSRVIPSDYVKEAE